MKKKMFYSDLAIESLSKATQNQDYHYEKKEFQGIVIETFDILKTSSLYPHGVGRYVEMICDLPLSIESLKSVLQQHLSSFLLPYQNPRILIVGLGNKELSCDALGPQVISRVHPTHHLSQQQRDSEHLYDISCCIPLVMAQSGMESASIIEAIVKKENIDVVIVIDALCALHYDKLGRVIQMNNVGIHPGSGVGNHRQGLNKEDLRADIIVIGVPTVIRATSLVNDVFSLMEGYFKESFEPSSKLKVGKRQTYQGSLDSSMKQRLFGEIGRLNEEERLSLLGEVLEPLNNQLVMSDKDVDWQVAMLSQVIALALNDLKREVV